MKFVKWRQEWYDNGDKLRTITETFEADSVNKLILDLIKNIDFTKDDLLISQGNEQIRIPEKTYEQLIPEVKQALKNESNSPKKDDYASNDRWVKENYWEYCKAYIFNFSTHTVSIDLDWGYEGIEGEREKYEFLQYEHPFIAEFINCMEARWGESNENEKIKKWLITVEGKQ